MNTTIEFERSLKKLNESQRNAVEAIEGPVMVLAGPGTGKTEVLSLRIGNILQKTDAKADNILCLTFSNAGVHSMKKRLKGLIGIESEKIEVSTYHSFGMDIILHSDLNNENKKKALLTEGQKFMLIEKLLSNKEVAGSYYDDKPLTTTKIKSTIKIINLFKKELIERTDVADFVERSLIILNNTQEFQLKKGGLNAGGKKVLEEINNFGKDFINIYEAYLKLLEEKNRFEFQDMLTDATYLLQCNPEYLRSLQIKYQYILVDEFQDTNIIHLSLIQLLIKDVENPNIFIVGDDDQTIYRFQGANLKNIEWVTNMIPDIKCILLDTNYRSTDTILKLAFELISKNKFRHSLKIKALNAGNQSLINVTYQQPVIHSYDTEEQESFAVCSKIKMRINDLKENETIAVLARTNKELLYVQKWLKYFEIPVKDKAERGNLLNTDYGRIFYYSINCINFLDKEPQIASDYFCNLLMESRYTNELVYGFLLYKSQKTEASFLAWLKDVENIERLTELKKQAIKIYDLFNLKARTTEWNGLFSKIEAFVYHLVKLSPTGDMKTALSSSVHSFLNNSFESVLDWFNYYYHFSLSIDYNDRISVPAKVYVRTIHASKGNEYDYVYIIGVENTNWEDAREPVIKVPKILNQFIYTEGNDEEDLRRLLYVGLTRAKKEIEISFHRKSSTDKVLNISRLLNNLIKDKVLTLVENENVLMPDILTDKYTLKLDEETLNLVKSKMLEFKISPSSTNAWENCQNKFFFNNICKLPGTPSSAMSFGSMIHKILEDISLSGNYKITRNDVTKKVNDVFVKFQLYFHPQHRNRYKQYALNIVINYLEKFTINNKPFKTEDYLCCEMDNGVKLNGFIDRIDVSGNNLLCIDYKTNKYAENLIPFIDNENHGSDYWRQGMIYKYLIKTNYPEFETIDMQFHYVAINKNLQHNTEENEDSFKEWLLSIWHSIHKLQFAKSCENPSCVYCGLKLSA